MVTSSCSILETIQLTAIRLDQPFRTACAANLCSLIRAFVVKGLDSRRFLVSISKIPILQLVSEAEEAGFSVT